MFKNNPAVTCLITFASGKCLKGILDEVCFLIPFGISKNGMVCFYAVLKENLFALRSRSSRF